MRYKLTPSLVVTLALLFCVLQATAYSRCYSQGRVYVYRRRAVRYCKYRYHGHVRRVYYRGSRPRFYAGRPRCARRCYVRYTYIRGRRVPVYTYTRRPVYGYRYVGRFTRRRRRVVYIKRPYYSVRKPYGRTYVVRGPLYGGYHHRRRHVHRPRHRFARSVYVRSARTQGRFRVSAKGCYYNGHFVRFGQVIHRSKCTKCRCLRIYNFAKLQCQTDGNCLQKQQGRKGRGMPSRKYGLERRGCRYAGQLVTFGASAQVAPCKTCTCTGTFSSAYMRCHVDMACIRGGCNYKGKLLPHNQSMIIGCKKCTCIKYGGRSILYCKTDKVCEKKARKIVGENVFKKKKPRKTGGNLNISITNIHHHHTKTVDKHPKDSETDSKKNSEKDPKRSSKDGSKTNNKDSKKDTPFERDTKPKKSDKKDHKKDSTNGSKDGSTKKDTPFEKEKKSRKSDRKDTPLSRDNNSDKQDTKIEHKRDTTIEHKEDTKIEHKRDTEIEHDKNDKPSRTKVITKRKHAVPYCRYNGRKLSNKETFILKKCIKCICMATVDRVEIHCSKDPACSKASKTTVLFDSTVEKNAVVCYHKGKKYTKGQSLTIFKRFCRCEQLNGEAVIRCYKTKPKGVTDTSKDTAEKTLSTEDKNKTAMAKKKAVETAKKKLADDKKKADAKKAAEIKRATDKKIAEIKKAAEKKIADIKKAAEKKTAERKTAEKKAVDKKTADKKAADKKAADRRKEEGKRVQERKKSEEAKKKNTPVEDEKDTEVAEESNTEISYSIRRNPHGCYFDGTHVPFNGKIERKCLVCICLQHTRQVFYCRKKLACIKGDSVATCYYNKNSYIIGEPFRRSCKYCFCGTDVDEKPIIRCYKDPSCYSGTTVFCRYGKRRYPMGVVFNIRKCVRCACLLINRRPQVRCTVDKKCMGERTQRNNTTVKVMSSKDAVREAAAVRERLKRKSTVESNAKQSEAYKRRMARERYQKQLAEEYQNSRYPRSINIFVNRPPPAAGRNSSARSAQRQELWSKGSAGWKARTEARGCILDGRSVGFNQRVRLSKCRTCVCLKMAQPAFYCKHDAGCAQSKAQQDVQQRIQRQDDTRRVKSDVRCRIGSVTMNQGQVIHLKHCTLCKCVQDENKKALLSCSYDKKCQKKSKDTPLVGINGKSIKKTEFDGCKRRGKLYSYGSGFLLGKCKECKCARVPSGKVFICKRKASCDTQMIQKNDQIVGADKDESHKKREKDESQKSKINESKIHKSKIHKSGSHKSDSHQSESRRSKIASSSKKTLIIITPRKEGKKNKKKEPTIFCIYQGTKTSLGKSVMISKCLTCVCKRQKFNPVFDCKKTRSCLLREHEKQKLREKEIEKKRKEKIRLWRQRRRRRRQRAERRARIRDMQLRARMRERRREREERERIRNGGSVTSRSSSGSSRGRRRTQVVQEGAGVSVGSSSVPVYGAPDGLIFVDHHSSHRHSHQARRPIVQSNSRRRHRHHSRRHRSNNYRLHYMGRSRDVLFAQDQENSGCSYAGITIPRGQRIILGACVSCQCTGYLGDRLMCHRVRGCNPNVHYPGCRYGGVTVPRKGVVLRGGCRYCRCNFGENGFEMKCRRQKHCDVSNRPPQSLSRLEYTDIHVRGGCRLAYGIIINHGSKVFDKRSCTTCICQYGHFHCAEHRSCQKQSGCFVDGRYAVPESHVVRGCRMCVCQEQGHFNCQLNSECVRRHH